MFKHWKIKKNSLGVIYKYYYQCGIKGYVVIEKKYHNSNNYFITGPGDVHINTGSAIEQAIEIAEKYIIKHKDDILKYQRREMLDRFKEFADLTEDLEGNNV